MGEESTAIGTATVSYNAYGSFLLTLDMGSLTSDGTITMPSVKEAVRVPSVTPLDTAQKRLMESLSSSTMMQVLSLDVVLWEGRRKIRSSS